MTEYCERGKHDFVSFGVSENKTHFFFVIYNEEKNVVIRCKKCGAQAENRE